ncbi:uncharacterized protein LOC130281773 isoform X2 [Hyla sarda]|uniref:uncharacterized protein LOC130281773 isoform X2 n=1 Tax=Hyla sarda TaxID=327740 RepID=UPI0024C390D5|nr:uncharacterized protein LOC130281773 isoform X2 [Hyla sarda]
MVKKNSIPERWRSLTAVGQRVPGSRFIAFKVPLKGVANQRVTQNQKFTPKDLVSAVRSQNEELGLVIDLTNTERYYTTKDLPKSVQYVKLHTAGLKIPDDATIHQFKRVVWKFLAANSDNDKLIGVHCTTGINRTGFLICRYLIDVDEWKPMHALTIFAQARGHCIEGTVYIEDIVKGPRRSNAGIDLPPTIDEPRLEDEDDLHRDGRPREDSIKSLLELIPGNEYADFDARRPPMRARSDEYQDDSREFYNPRPDFRGRMPPLGDMDDVDLRLPMEHRDFPSNISERFGAPEMFQRPGDLDGRYNPGLENRQDFQSSEPRPLMDVRDNYGPREMQRPRGMPHEQMGYDDRTRGQQSPAQGFYKEPAPNRIQSFPPGKMSSAEYDDMEAEPRMRPLNRDFNFRESVHRPEFQSTEIENYMFDPRDRETMAGPYNERMHPRNARVLDGHMNDRMNARNPQQLGDRRDMEGPIQERMQSRDGRFMEGFVNERYPQRDAQGIRNVMDDRMHLPNGRPMNGPVIERIQSRDAQFMEGPMNNRMYPRDTRQMEGSANERMQPRVGRFMDLPLKEKLNPRNQQPMGNENMPSKDLRALSLLINEMMSSRDPGPMEGPQNARMHPRIDRAMEGGINNQMYSREGPMKEHVPLRDTRAPEELMNVHMYQRDVGTIQGSMNEPMHPRDSRAMEGSMKERMYMRGAEFPMNKQRYFMDDTRPFEGRKMNPSEDFKGANRFAPYPFPNKQVQPSEISREPPRHDIRDPRNILPPSQNAIGYPPRSRFN